jgi:hypothetical protein
MNRFLLHPLDLGRRWIVVAALLVAAAAHLPVIGEHLMEARYMGVLFIVLTAACFLLAAALISLDSAAAYALSALTCALAVLGYAATRTFAFPHLSDDVGNWSEPLGVVSIVAESIAAAVAVSVFATAARRVGRAGALRARASAAAR